MKSEPTQKSIIKSDPKPEAKKTQKIVKPQPQQRTSIQVSSECKKSSIKGPGTFNHPILDHYPGFEISGRENEYFRSPLVSQFVRDTQTQVFVTLDDFKSDYLEKLEKLHKKDSKCRKKQEIYALR